MAVAKPTAKLVVDGVMGQKTRDAFCWLLGLNQVTSGDSIEGMGSTVVAKWQDWLNNHRGRLNEQYIDPNFGSTQTVTEYCTQSNGTPILEEDGVWGARTSIASGTHFGCGPYGVGGIDGGIATENKLSGLGESITKLQNWLNYKMGYSVTW